MCKILGKEFQQYLPVVMGPLMKTASIKPEVALLDSKSSTPPQPPTTMGTRALPILGYQTPPNHHVD